jgi:hypothetical protein
MVGLYYQLIEGVDRSIQPEETLEDRSKEKEATAHILLLVKLNGRFDPAHKS